jgi:hypothetical protein
MDTTLVVVAASIVVHGVSVTPLMRRYSGFIPPLLSARSATPAPSRGR